MQDEDTLTQKPWLLHSSPSFISHGVGVIDDLQRCWEREPYTKSLTSMWHHALSDSLWYLATQPRGRGVHEQMTLPDMRQAVFTLNAHRHPRHMEFIVEAGRFLQACVQRKKDGQKEGECFGSEAGLEPDLSLKDESFKDLSVYLMLTVLVVYQSLIGRKGQLAWLSAVLQVSISLNKVELSVGESKFFTCTVIGEPLNINWFNPQGERIISNQRVVLHTEGVRSRLTIYNAIIEDAGIYRCQAVDAKGQTQEATVVLEIYHRLQVLPNNNLQILKVAKEDEGVYRCEARVEARGEIDFRDIVVVVNVPPVLSVPQESFNATADYQESVTFTCITSGSPDPEVTWHRKGRQIERSEQYVLGTLEGGKSTLTIRNIKQGDGGPYTCRSSNKAGSKESEILLKVFGEYINIFVSS
ncbi:hypothetical protein NFI96_007300 [Prochilodus magdalenae]|nr:hypothetical protein NFI96_007300 [Prochilodus magdalenae]